MEMMLKSQMRNQMKMVHLMKRMLRMKMKLAFHTYKRITSKTKKMMKTLMPKKLLLIRLVTQRKVLNLKKMKTLMKMKSMICMRVMKLLNWQPLMMIVTQELLERGNSMAKKTAIQNNELNKKLNLIG